MIIINLSFFFKFFIFCFLLFVSHFKHLKNILPFFINIYSLFFHLISTSFSFPHYVNVIYHICYFFITKKKHITFFFTFFCLSISLFLLLNSFQNKINSCFLFFFHVFILHPDIIVSLDEDDEHRWAYDKNRKGS